MTLGKSSAVRRDPLSTILAYIVVYPTTQSTAVILVKKRKPNEILSCKYKNETEGLMAQLIAFAQAFSEPIQTRKQRPVQICSLEVMCESYQQ